MADTIKRFEGLYTLDALKKKRVWHDCIAVVDLEKSHIRIEAANPKQQCEAPSNARTIFNGTISREKMKALLEMLESKLLESLVLQLVSHREATASVATIKQDVVKPQLSLQKPFRAPKPAIFNRAFTTDENDSKLRQYASIIMKAQNPLQMPFRPPTNDKESTITGTINTTFTGKHPSRADVSSPGFNNLISGSNTVLISRHDTSTSSFSAGSPRNASASRLWSPLVRYQNRRRRATLEWRFQTAQLYSEAYLAAVTEEILLVVASNMIAQEGRVLASLQTSNSPPSSSTNTATAASSAPCRVYVSTQKTTSCSLRSVGDKIRASGAAFIFNVEIAMYQQKNADWKDNKGDFKKMSGSFRPMKRKRGDDNESSDDDDERCDKENKIKGGRDRDGGALKTLRVYLKIPEYCSSCPKNSEAYSKGDIWILWKPKSEVASVGAVLSHGYPHSSHPIATVNAGEEETRKVNDSRRRFLHSRGCSPAPVGGGAVSLGYPLPWMDGMLWQDIWLVRSLWHAKGMLKVEGFPQAFLVSADGSSYKPSQDMPDWITKLASKRSKNHHSSGGDGGGGGELDGNFCGLRVSSELTTLLCFDLLASSSGKKNCIASALARAPTTSELMRCAVFMRALSSDFLLSDASVVRQSSTISSSSNSRTNAPYESKLELKTPSRGPQMPHRMSEGRHEGESAASCSGGVTFSQEYVQGELNAVCSEFSLNFDQQSVLRKVAGWFVAESSKSSSTSECEKTDLFDDSIILVNGVFGSGKSHLLASVCVFLKRITTNSQTLTDGSLFSTRCMNQQQQRQQQRIPRIRCMVSANTNVAVDRVLSLLAARQVESTNNNSKNDDSSEGIIATASSEQALVGEPVFARVGCVGKIDKGLRKHFVASTHHLPSIQAEIARALRAEQQQQKLQQGHSSSSHVSRDSCLEALAAAVKKPGFMEMQRRLLVSADVVGVTCASAGMSLSSAALASASTETERASNNAAISMSVKIGIKKQSQRVDMFSSPSNVALQDIGFDVLLLDEASQMTEPVSLLALACGRPHKLIVVGDPKQLPPALAMESLSSSSSGKKVRSEIPGDGSNLPGYLSRTLYDRLRELGWREHVLCTQYRCHPHIAEVCSVLFYEGKLLHGVKEAERQPVVPGLPPMSSVHCDCQEQRRGDSFVSFTEANLIRNLISWIVTKRTSCSTNTRQAQVLTLGVICMYRAQVQVIEGTLGEILSILDASHFHVKVSTVDAFQGCEMDVIVIATTRTTVTEFLSNPCRVNVSLSRARHHVIVVGNTFENGPNSSYNSCSSSSYNDNDSSSGLLGLRRCPVWGKVLTRCHVNARSLEELKNLLAIPIPPPPL